MKVVFPLEAPPPTIGTRAPRVYVCDAFSVAENSSYTLVYSRDDQIVLSSGHGSTWFKAGISNLWRWNPLILRYYPCAIAILLLTDVDGVEFNSLGCEFFFSYCDADVILTRCLPAWETSGIRKNQWKDKLHFQVWIVVSCASGSVIDWLQSVGKMRRFVQLLLLVRMVRWSKQWLLMNEWLKLRLNNGKVKQADF